MHPVLIAYLGGVAPTLICFCVVMQSLMDRWEDRMLAYTLSFVVGMAWPVVMLYLLVFLLQNRRQTTSDAPESTK